MPAALEDDEEDEPPDTEVLDCELFTSSPSAPELEAVSLGADPVAAAPG